MTAKRLLQSFIRTTTIAAMIVFMGAGLAQAQSTWYVSSTEGDNNNDGSQMENAGAGVGPFASIGTAISAASDGDTIVVLAGAYAEGGAVLLDKSVTLQAVASGINLDVNVNATLELDDVLGAAITSGTGLFSFTGDVTLDAGTLTLATGELELADGVTVNVVDGTMASASPAYAGEYNLVYDPTNVDDADVTVGTEFDGDTGTGTIQVDADYDNGTLTFGVDVITTTLDVNGDANVTISGDLTGDIDTDGAGTTTVSGDVTGDVSTAAAGALDVSGDVTGDVVTAGTGNTTIGGNVVGLDITLGSTGDFEVTGTVTLDNDFDHNAGTATVGGATTVTGITIDGAATFAAVSSDADAVIDAAGLAVSMASLALTGAGSDLTVTDGNVTISGELSLPHIDDGIVITHTAGTTEVGSIVLGLEDDDDADDEDFPSILDVDAGSFTVNGAVTESSLLSENGGTDTAVLEITLAAGALIVFESSTTVSGDVTSAAADFDDTEGIEVGAGATVSLAFDGAHADLGFWGGDGTLAITNGAGNDISTLSEGSNFTLSVARDMDTAFNFTGNVAFEAASAVTITGALFNVDGNLTSSAAVSFDDGGDAADAFVVSGNLTTTGAGAITFGDPDDGDDIEVTGDVNGNITSAGTMDVDGDATLTGGTVASTVNFAGDLTIPAEASVTFTEVGEDLSDVEGALTVNGTLTLTTQGGYDNLSVGCAAIGVDGELDLDGTNGLILAGDFVGGLLTDADDVEINAPAGGATFAPAPNTTVANLLLVAQAVRLLYQKALQREVSRSETTQLLLSGIIPLRFPTM